MKPYYRLAMIVATIACLAVAVQAAPTGDQDQNWLAALASSTDSAATAPADAEAPQDDADASGSADRKGMPIPFHSIEGYSGGTITPLAYLCNSCNCGCGGKHLTPPSVSYTYVGMGSKRLHSVAVTQSFLNRFEFGYAMNQFHLGSFHEDLRKAGLNPERRDVMLHHFNFRAKLLEENSFDLPLPAITAGVHVKYNNGIDSIDRRLGGALSSIGYDKHYGVDYTLTGTKMFPKLAFGRPVVVTAGVRFSKAAQLGLMGFGKACRASLEGSVICLPTDWLVVGYEFRQKHNPYGQIPGLIGDEDNWQAISASIIVNKHLTILAMAGLCGNVANANADTTWGLQAKWEF